ncbi:MAG: hypothetical protein KC729_07980, partial [Candidatus Eisenbacteria bacterium]|nr:hypothetical protein [Candidatus Eisenbacteria bacterium]
MNQLPTRPALSTPDARELDPRDLSQPSSPKDTPVTRRLARGSIRARSVGCLLLLLGAWLPAADAAPVGTAFTYQGRLDQLGVPANGNCQFRFSLWNAEVGGTQIGDLLEIPTALSDGTFTVQLDFGPGAFDGEERWLDIAVLCDGDVEWTPLDPRQPITPGPYSIYSSTGAGGGDGVWTTGTWGIEHFGNVGIGVSAHPGFRLRVGTSTENLNPMQVTNNNASFAAFWVQNLATDGIGIYDADSDRHFLGGRLGIGTINPASPLHVYTNNSNGIKAESFGDGVFGTLDAAVWAKGNGSVLTSKCAGLYAESSYGNGVEGYASDASSYGGYFQNLSGGTALYANGIAKVKTLQILGGADLVEGFDTSESAAREPGTVVVIDPAHPGALRAA